MVEIERQNDHGADERIEDEIRYLVQPAHPGFFQYLRDVVVMEGMPKGVAVTGNHQGRQEQIGQTGF